MLWTTLTSPGMAVRSLLCRALAIPCSAMAGVLSFEALTAGEHLQSQTEDVADHLHAFTQTSTPQRSSHHRMGLRMCSLLKPLMG